MDLETQQSPADAAKPDLSHNLNSGPDTISGSSSSSNSNSNSGNSTNKDALALVLSPSVTLTLSDNALLLSGAELVTTIKKKSSRRCLPRLKDQASKSVPSSIPFYNILWAEVSADGRWVQIDYAAETKVHYLEPRTVRLAISPSPASPEAAAAGNAVQDGIVSWLDRLLDRAYGNAARRKRAWVLVNPHAGPGGAVKIWEKQVKPIFEAARMPLTVVHTTHHGQAVDLARDLNIDDYDIAIPCSGDGLPHEVFNGLGKRPDARRALSKIAVCHIPCGSGNAMSCNLYGTHRPTLAALAIVKGVPTPLDLVSVTHGNERTLSFLSQSLGLIAEIDLGTEHLRWMGHMRFTYGFLVRAVLKKTYPCDIAVKVEIDQKEDVKKHYREQVAQAGTALPSPPGEADAEEGLGLPPLKYGTVQDKLPEEWELIRHDKLGSFYCGNMAYMAPDANFFSAALANDGLMDLITTDGDISPMKAIQLQLDVESGRFFDNPLVSYRKVVAYRVTPRDQDSGYISIDGEPIPFGPIQAEVHRGLGLTLSKNGGFEAPGPMNWDTVTTSERLLA
ncbi:hypothetical protein VTJ04DRAFT_4147 [Mycothermus thermophilus]|uniref:uncharacterized protein n=1 Tax=Humicola insolens TaxID=85995 RepID=UPI003742934F